MKQHWSNVDRSDNRRKAKGVPAGALFAIGFPAEIVMGNARGPGLSYAIGVIFDWHPETRAKPGTLMKLSPMCSLFGSPLLTGKRTLDHTLADLAFGHALRLDLDLGQEPHRTQLAAHIARNSTRDHVFIPARDDGRAVVEQIDYRDLLSFTGANISDLWALWPGFRKGGRQRRT